MSWSPARCSTWLKNYADDVAGDAYKMGGDNLLYACAGVAYYTINMGIGYNSESEFRDLLRSHMGLDEDFIADAVEEITK